MSKYTTEVRFICESLTGNTESQGFNNVNSIITQAAPLVFDFNFPIFDEAYRLPLERQILRHYYTREISEETVGLWKLRLEDRLNVIMPYYNQLYQSALLSFNPFYDVDLTTEHTGSGVNSSSGDSTENTSKDITNDNQINVKGSESNLKSGNNNRMNEENESKENEHTGDVKDSGSKTQLITNSQNGNEEYNEENSYDKQNSYEGNNNTTNTGERTSAAEDNNLTETENDNTSWNLFSDTPQGGINGVEGSGSATVDSMYYLTNATKNTSHDEGCTESTGKRKENETAVNVNSGNENYESNETNEGTKTTTLNRKNDNVESGDYSEDNTKTYNENIEENTTRKGNEYNDYNEVNNTDLDRNTSMNGSVNESVHGNKTNTNVSTNAEEYLQKVSGKSGGMTYSAMLREYRETFINIDEMVIEELSDLFFGLW